MASPKRKVALLVLSLVVLLFSPLLESAECKRHFRRGDPNQDGHMDVGDGVAILWYLFNDPDWLNCPDAADADDSGVLDLTDVIYSLQFLFLDGFPPPDPGIVDCGLDPTPDQLDCRSYRFCAELDRCGDRSCCPSGFYCAKLEGDCDGEGTCEEVPLACPEVYLPVCGCNGITYDNGCTAAMAGVNVSYERECEPPEDPTDRWVQTAGPPTGTDLRIEIYGPTLGGGMHAASVDAATYTPTWTPGSNLTAPVYHVQVAVHPNKSDVLFASYFRVLRQVRPICRWASDVSHLFPAGSRRMISPPRHDPLDIIL